MNLEQQVEDLKQMQMHFDVSQIHLSAWISKNWLICESDETLLGEFLFLLELGCKELRSFSSFLVLPSYSYSSSATSLGGVFASVILTARFTILFSKAVILSALVRLSDIKFWLVSL